MVSRTTDMLDDEPPPSYEEATQGKRPPPPPLPPRLMGAGGGERRSYVPAQTFQQLLQQHQLGGTVARQFPPAVNLYRDAFPGALQRRHFLGEHQSAPLYAVGAWVGWSSTQASLVLHNGPSEDYAPLATAVYDSWGRRMDVTLPPPPLSEDSLPPVQVHVPTVAAGSSSSGSSTFGFQIEVPRPGGAWRKEAFEWRRSNSLAVAGLVGASSGWKLVRLCDELPWGGAGRPVHVMAGSGPPTGDGHETVAVCTSAVMSLTKLWKFMFLGTGVSGALGERWAIMAVMTGLTIWDRDSRRPTV